MKKSLLFLFIVLTIMVQGQNFQPFHADAEKVFSTYPVKGQTYSLAFDSVVNVSGGGFIYYPYMGISTTTIESEDCEFWGGPTCNPHDKPNWIGNFITVTSSGLYQFNHNGSVISFDFNLPQGESFVFYEDLTERFSIISQGVQQQTILGITDSVRVFTIANTDLNGTILDTPLNGKIISVGKELGLINFIRIEDFPNTQIPIELIGSTSPVAGLTELTTNMIYNHQPGDVIQYYHSSRYDGGPPEMNFIRYEKYTFLERTEVNDSLIYTVETDVFDEGSLIIFNDIITLKYPLNQVIAELPFDYVDKGTTLINSSLNYNYYCNMELITYTQSPGFLIYCPEENCWGSYDIPGPAPVESKVLVEGLGVYLDEMSVMISGGFNSYQRKVIYFNKEGVECGEEAIVSVRKHSLNKSLTLFPNPATDHISVKSNLVTEGKVEIYTMNGQLVKVATFANPYESIDISSLKSGIYLVKVIDKDMVLTAKLVKE